MALNDLCVSMCHQTLPDAYGWTSATILLIPSFIIIAGSQEDFEVTLSGDQR